jgi:hypothetical protein
VWPDLLRRLSTEALSLAALTARIEDALGEAATGSHGTGEILARGARAAGVIPLEVQQLDRLCQTLEDLGRLMMALSVQAPDTPLDPVPLSTMLTQRALAGRLLNGDDRPDPGGSAESGGLTIL